MDERWAQDLLARDLVTLWQSELTAMAADREIREGWAALFALWAQSMQAGAVLLRDGQARGASPAQPAGAAAVATASGPGVGEIERLSRRIAELERILAGLRAGGPGDGAGGAESGG